MAIGSFLRSLVNAEAAGDQVIISLQSLYEKTKQYNPAEDPHIILAMTYLARIKARVISIPMSRKIDPKNPETNSLVLTETLLFSCLDEGHNIRALALKVLQDERPDIWEKYPKFEADFNMRVSVLFEKMERGRSIFDLYKTRNPQLQLAHLQPHILAMLQSGKFDHLL